MFFCIQKKIIKSALTSHVCDCKNRIITYIHRQMYTVSHTQFLHEQLTYQKKILFFKTLFLINNYYKFQSGNRPLFAWKGMQGLHSASRQAFDLIYTPLHDPLKHNSSTAGSEVFTGFYRKAVCLCIRMNMCTCMNMCTYV